MNRRFIEFIVGLFMVAGIAALVFLALKVSGLTRIGHSGSYQVIAYFDNVGDLKPRAPVRIAGVRVGEVGSIHLNPEDFRASVVLLIDDSEKNIPVDTTAAIYTEGLLGSNYISLTPGYEKENLHDGSLIQNTTSALVLEKLIGQFLFNAQKSGNEGKP